MAEETRINVLEINTKDSQRSITDLKKRIKELKTEILNAEEGTEEWKEKMNELGDAQHEYVAIAQDAKYMSQDFGEILANTAGVASSVTSAIGGLTAGLQLMGVESEKTQEATLKLFQLMSIAQSFTVLEDGVKRVKGLALGIKLATKNVNKLKLALSSIGIGAAVAAIGVLVSKLAKLQEQTEEVKNEYREYNEAISGNIANLEKLRSGFNAYGDDIEGKRQYLLDHAEDFKNLGVNVNDVNIAEKQLNENFDELIAKIKRSQDLQDLNQQLEESVRRMRDAQSEKERLQKKDEEGKWRIGSIVKQDQIISEEEDLQKEILGKIVVIENDITNEKNEQKQIEEDLKNKEEEKERRAEEYRKKLAEQTAELQRQKELREQALVWAETEEDLEDETPTIETGNENFKYTNYTDDDYYNQAVEVAQAVSDAEIDIALETSERLNEIDEERKQKRLETTRGTIDGMMMIASTTSQLLSSIQSNIDTSTKKGFEENKKYERAQATISYLQGLVSAWSSAMQLPAFLIPIVGASLTGLLSGVYGVNMAKINSTKFGGSTSASSTNVPNINSSAINALNAPQLTNARPTFMEGDVENLPAQKVYVLSSEIEDSLNMRKTTIRNSTF